MNAITPYLNFDGNCREAMTFYQEILGGKLDVMTFGQGNFAAPPGSEERLIHAYLAGGSVVLMASDTMPGMPFQQGNNVWLNLACGTSGEVDSLFPRLSAGGQEAVAPHDSFWGARFAMLTDRFGVHWMLSHDREARQT